MESTPTSHDFTEACRAYRQGGLSLVPVSEEDKLPRSDLLPRNEQGKATWKPFQTNPPEEAAVEEWLAHDLQAVAAVGGEVSGGLLVFAS